MKLFRFGNPGNELPGLLDDQGIHWDVSAFKKDYDPSFFGSNGIRELLQWFRVNQQNCRQLSKVERFAPPLVNSSKIICIGLNFSDHAAESNMTLPAEPVVFFKSTTAITGPNDPITIPKTSTKTDWEVELAVVIGKRTSYVDEANAMQSVAGYMLHNDYSERAFQLERAGQWVKGKSCDTFAPIGPYIVAADQLDISNLSMWLDVNGKRMQDASTATMVFKVPFLISYLSQFMTLLPGDIISTGTPAGVGLGQKPDPVYLKEGDVVELGIENLGSARQVLVSWKPSN